MMRCLLAFLVSLLALSACQSNAAGGDPQNSNSIQWDRSPSSVVFRADVVGGSDEANFASRNEVPPCTVYGDNRVVWLNQLGPYETQVLWDQVADQSVRDFVSALTVNERFYDYEARANLQPATSVRPVIETLMLFVNDEERQSDSYSGWEGDYYRRILSKCQTISTTPILFEPSEAWVSAEAIPADQADTSTFNVPWDAEANRLSFAEVAESGERRWITDRNVLVLWNLIRNSPSNLRFTEDDQHYRVALEAPGVTRHAPPAPATTG